MTSSKMNQYERDLINLYVELDILNDFKFTYSSIKKPVLGDFTFIFTKINDIENSYYKCIHKIRDYLSPNDERNLEEALRKFRTIKNISLRFKRINKLNLSKIMDEMPLAELENLDASLKSAIQRAAYGFKYFDFNPTIRKHQRLHKQLRLENEIAEERN